MMSRLFNFLQGVGTLLGVIGGLAYLYALLTPVIPRTLYARVENGKPCQHGEHGE
jgi:hypothetical protein